MTDALVTRRTGTARPANLHPTAQRRARLAGVAVLTAALLTGCASVPPVPTAPPNLDLESYDGASGNGLWLLDGAAAEREILDAVREAGPVTLSGSFTELVQPDPEADPVRGRTITVDLHGRTDSFTATVSAGDVQASILVDAGQTRVRGNAAYAATMGAPELADRVTCTVGVDPSLERWSPVLNPADLIETVLANVELGVASPAGDEETLEVVVGTDESALGTLTVDRSGPPLPRTFTAADASGDAAFTFADWGAAPDLAAAAAALPCPDT